MFPYKLFLLAILLVAATAWASASRVTALGAAPVGARALETNVSAPYPDNARGLKQELKDILNAARSRRSDQLRGMVMDLEIPNARAWYLANFGTSGLETAGEYEKNLTTSEERFENQMIEFAGEEGYFSVKKQDAKKVYPSLVTTPEVFLAAWERTSVYEEDRSATPFGYFLFVDGKFRWDSTIMWVTVE